MRRAEIITASLLVLLGGLVIIDAVRLGIGWGTDGPKSGFFPFWLAFIMVVACGFILAQEARNHVPRSFVERDKLALVLTVLWPAVAAVGLMQWLGLYLSSALYLGFYMRWVGRHGWATVILLALCIPLGIFFVFEQWFLVPMPKGPLEAWFGY